MSNRSMALTEEILENGFVRLEPLGEVHRAGLHDATHADETVWRELFPISMVGSHFDDFWQDMQQKRRNGYALPYAVLRSDLCVGFTAYLRINPSWCSLDIGGTYYRPEVRGSAVNPSAKLLLLDHAFSCGVRRVQFRVDALNARSRAAVLRLGATQEGIIRREKPTWTGRVQDTVVFSILDEEWPKVRSGLTARLRRLETPNSTDGTELRLLREADTVSAEALLRTAFAAYVRKLGREQTPGAYHDLPAAIAEERVYGAFRGERLVGVAITNRDTVGWSLEQIGVAPALQGAGIGSRMLQVLEVEARMAGATTLSLDTAEIMEDLIGFYRRHGFREVRRAPPSHGKDGYLRVYLKKSL